MRRGFGFHDRHSPFRFQPATLFASGEQGIWYDPSDFSTMFQDVAGTTPVTDVGQSVALIRDKSGRGNHATQSVLGSRPTVNVDASGKYFLLFDGSDDSMLTGSINFSATDKMTVFAGVRKLSDAARSMLAELGNNVAGSFRLEAPNAATPTYQFSSAGTTVVGATTNSVYAAPTTNVLTGIGNIAGDVSQIRVNGALANQNLSDQGTGNYSNNPIYIGRRNNATLPFNGRLYGLIVRGAASNDWQLFAAEQWMAAKTGISI